MATWVNLRHAAEFIDIVKVYSRESGGQGSTQSAGATVPANAKMGFMTTVKRAVQSGLLPAWIRHPPGASKDWQDVQIDVSAVPGVRKLRANGKWINF